MVMNFSTPGIENFTNAETIPLNIEPTYRTGELKLYNHSNMNTTEEVQYPPNVVVFGATSMFLLSTMAIVGNFISILALSKSKKLKRVTTAIIVNLCVSDLFLSCCDFINSIHICIARQWNGGNTSCKTHHILIYFFASVSIFTAVAITINRYVLIVHPRYYQDIFRKRNASIVIISTWAISAVLTLLPYFKVWGEIGYDPGTGECAIMNTDGKSEIYNLVVAYFIPLILFVICYAKMFYVVRKSERKTSRHDRSMHAYVERFTEKYWLQLMREGSTDESTYRHLRNKTEWRLFQMIAVMFVCFVLCFVPVSLMKMLRKEREYPSLYILCHQGLHLSNVVNPIIYVVMNKEYRKAYKELLQ